jgi:hypothetical protein
VLSYTIGFLSNFALSGSIGGGGGIFSLDATVVSVVLFAATLPLLHETENKYVIESNAILSCLVSIILFV